MLYIPTRSDVKDKNYQREIKKDFYYNRLDCSFSWPLRYISVESVLLDFENKGADFVNLSEVFENIKSIIDEYQDLLIQAKGEGFIQTKYQSAFSVNPNYEIYSSECFKGHRMRKLQRSLNEHFFEIKNIYRVFKNENCLKFNPVKLKYSPFELAMCELESFKHDLEKVSNKNKTSLVDLLRMDNVISQYQDNANEKLILGHLIKDYVSWRLKEMENDEYQEAGVLKEWHMEIARKSDIYLKFDESYWNCKNKKGSVDRWIPFNQEYYLKGLHEITSDYLENKGQIIINGIDFYKENLSIRTNQKGLDFQNLFEYKLIDKSFESVGFKGASHIG